jgi:hypothetical protein
MVAALEVIDQKDGPRCEIYMVRYQGGNWTVVFHDDPGLDFAVTPAGYVCCDIYQPFGPYTHPMVPDEFFEQLDAILHAFE